MTGITLIYCVWLSPQEFYNASVNEDISACSVVLFVMAERLRTETAKRYRNAFELVRQKVLDHVSRNGPHIPRRQIDTLNVALESTIRQLEEEQDDCFADFGHMITDIAGEQFSSSTLATPQEEPGKQALHVQHHEMGSLRGSPGAISFSDLNYLDDDDFTTWGSMVSIPSNDANGLLPAHSFGGVRP